MTLRLTKREAEEIKRRVDLARRYAKEQFHDDCDLAWRLYEAEMEGKDAVEVAGDRIEINVLLPAVETQVAATAFRVPSFVLTPENREAAGAMPASRDALSYEYRTSGAQAEAIDALRDRLVSGLGIQQVDWIFVTETVDGEEQVHTYGRQGGRGAGELGGGAELEPEGPLEDSFALPPAPAPQAPLPSLDMDLDMPQGVDLQREDETIETVREDRIHTARIDPKTFWIDPECGRDHERAIFLGWTERRPLAEVKRDEKLKATRDLKGSADHLREWMGDDLKAEKAEKIPDDLKRVDLHHYYEKARRLHVVVSDESDTPHLVERWSWEHPRYPVRVMRYKGNPSRFFPMSPLVQVRHPQREINLCREVLAAHVRQSNPRLQYSGRLNERQRRQVESAKTLSVVELDTEEKIGAVPIPQVQPEIFTSEAKAREDIQLILGLSEYQGASPPTKRLTTTEVQVIASQGNVRGATLRDEFEEHCSGIAADMLALLQQNAVKTRSLPIFDDAGVAAGFRDYSRNDIQGDFIVQVRVGSMRPPSAESNLENLGFLMQAFTNAAQGILVGQQVGINLRELLRDMLADNPMVKDINRIVPELGGAQPALPASGLQAPPGVPGPAGMGGMEGGGSPSSLSPELLELLTQFLVGNTA